MIDTSKTEYKDLNDTFKNAFGEKIPLMMIPESETFDGLKSKVMESIKCNTNLLPKFYSWNDSVLY